MPELLVPAGSPEAVTAAVQNGADAVYLSFDELNACREAENFSDSAFETSVRYCRIRGCRVYLALNSSVREEELPKAGGLALRAQRAGVDAVIVRDLGVFFLLRRLLPEMPLFADVSLGFYTPEGAAAAAALGFRRIFLPPELPLEEIRRVAAAEIETAVFVQCSLCAAAAGTCRMGALTDGKSAERGMCSRVCRERFTLGGRWDDKPLSWKDRSLLPALRELADAGVTSFCLGDRGRGPEYTAAYTAVFRTAIDEGRLPAASELERMESAFSPWGVAKERIYEPAEAPERSVRAEERFLAEIRKTYTDAELRRVPVRFAVAAERDDAPVRLGVQDEDKNIAVLEDPAPDPLGDMELTEEDLRASMYRTAGTPFRCEEVECVLKEGLRVSEMELDAARRRLLFRLSEKRGEIPARKEGTYPAAPATVPAGRIPVMIFSFRTREQLAPELAAFRPAAVYLPLELLAEAPEELAPFREAGAEVAAVMPGTACGAEETAKLVDLLAKAAEAGATHAVAGDLAMAALADGAGLKLRGGLGLSASNAFALQSLKTAGFQSACLSPELTLAQIAAMPKPLDTELVIYGRLPAMVSETCLIKASAGRCACSTPGQMSDRNGDVWPVTRDFGCRNTVWAPRKLWLGDRTGDWIGLGAWAVRLQFSTESPRECLDVANSIFNATGYRPNGTTRGAYYRGTF